MKSVLIVVVGLTLALSSHAAVPELSGAIVLEGRAHLVLVDPDTGTTSKWLNLGDDFAGYKIKDYHMESATVVLEHDGTEFSIALRKPVLLPPPAKSFSLQVLSDGQLVLNDIPISLPNLPQVLQSSGVTNQDDFHIAVDAKANFPAVREVFDLLRKNGYRRIRIETISKPTDPSP